MRNTSLIHRSAACRKFIEAAGHATQSFGFGRIIGHIFALLYLNPKPLCLDDIATELGVSKASVSTAVRQLERWAAIQKIWVRGDRRDFYEAQTDFNAVLRHGFLTTLRKKVDTAAQQISQVENSLRETLNAAEGDERKEIEVVTERLQQARKFHDKISGLLSNPLVDHLL